MSAPAGAANKEKGIAWSNGKYLEKVLSTVFSESVQAVYAQQVANGVFGRFII